MQYSVSLPEWTHVVLQQAKKEDWRDDQYKMQFVLNLARKNIEHKTGGPFAAAVFDTLSGECISIGVNRVMTSSNSSAHAEVVALSLAQKVLNTFDLSSQNRKLQLVVSWCPCVMCYGATLWSGIRSLVIAGDGDILRSITGFDEGPMPNQWEQEFKTRGIEVRKNILKDQAIDIFHLYMQSGAKVYNPSR